ncbi:hypothetical protein LTR62_003436 [Meristemomyces frigidus]|uniref:Uncharacterized protein n=1 Tax=Meristemomyces frigidus TaxID=1508187 RepID=A0AAN7TKX5_9PEZI|nr:hypothetical protein LTR62_003436 [Meristemomyces frigidus]
MVAVQAITIINSSGKIVKTTKTLGSLFSEAKAAYNEKKAEIKAVRRDALDNKESERIPRKRLEGLTLADYNSRNGGSRRSSKDGRKDSCRTAPRTSRPPIERGYTDSFYTNDLEIPPPNRPSPLRQTSSTSQYTFDPRKNELTRRHTTDLELAHRHRPATARSASLDDIDMDLAYGDFPPPLPERKYDDEVALRVKMSGLQRMLDEANCVQHSVTAIIDNLGKNPEALAAVALTLGEISSLATKLAPGALMSMKGAFPAILALLASPQFAIAVGVGVGVTIIAFGGYKIIKKIKASKEESNAARLPQNGTPALLDDGTTTPPQEGLEELREISSIERWRRGITDDEGGNVNGSIGTSVEAEFLTPWATRTLIEEGRLTEGDLKSTVSGTEGKRRRRKTTRGGSEVSGSAKGRENSGEAKTKKKREPSGLRMLFRTGA